MDKKEWIPCSERMPVEKGSDRIVKCWVAICGFEHSLLPVEPKYVSLVRKATYSEFFGWDGDYPLPGLPMLKIVAWMPYYEPEPYVEPRTACKLCCGEKVFPSGEVCWRCGGRGDEAADGSDAVQKFRGYV